MAEGDHYQTMEWPWNHYCERPPTLDLVPVKKAKPPSTLPKSLSIADLSPAPMHRSKLCVAYQGVPTAYYEATAGKAYPTYEAIPCNQFEVVFQAVELCIADRIMLLVENSLGGYIHQNYDLLLCHCLHIIDEVQLPVYHCLLALPGIRKEYLTCVISHPQALSQCRHTLTKMGLNSWGWRVGGWKRRFFFSWRRTLI
ncbi:Arogenate dehydratase/prephenate dehydratase 6 [Abeliophyllum distichum]|uniref:Arogenate dehydratase/prephenate dehydratase 6 n=1 Tax=Abeliophyllum distichum TaxID=126358 RepID=A0ABD1SAI5_9LAMI